MQSSLSFIHVYILNTQVDQLIFLMSDKITISHLSHIKVDNSIYLIKLSTCVLTFIPRHTCNHSTLLSLRSNIVHFEYVTHTCGHVSEVASKVNGGGNDCCLCSIKHLIMMSDTVALLLSKVERRLYSLILNNIFNFYYSLSLLHIEAVKYHLLFFIIKWMSIVFNCSTDVQKKKNITLPIIFPFVMYFGFATLVLIWKNDSICIFKL